MIGIKGTLSEAKQILEVARLHLKDMELTLSESKTKLTNINLSSALFLGTNIKRASKYSFARTSHNNLLRRNSKKLRLEAPISRILEKLKEADFIKSGKSNPKAV